MTYTEHAMDVLHRLKRQGRTLKFDMDREGVDFVSTFLFWSHWVRSPWDSLSPDSRLSFGLFGSYWVSLGVLKFIWLYLGLCGSPWDS